MGGDGLKAERGPGTRMWHLLHLWLSDACIPMQQPREENLHERKARPRMHTRTHMHTSMVYPTTDTYTCLHTPYTFLHIHSSVKRHTLSFQRFSCLFLWGSPCCGRNIGKPGSYLTPF